MFVKHQCPLLPQHVKCRLDLWPTDLNIRDHLLITDYLPIKFKASRAKRSWVISSTSCIVDRPSYQPTKRHTDKCKAICPSFFKRRGRGGGGGGIKSHTKGQQAKVLKTNLTRKLTKSRRALQGQCLSFTKVGKRSFYGTIGKVLS